MVTQGRGIYFRDISPLCGQGRGCGGRWQKEEVATWPVKSALVPLTVRSLSRDCCGSAYLSLSSQKQACQLVRQLVVALPEASHHPESPGAFSACCCGACSRVVRGGPADWEYCSEAAPFIMCVHRQLATT